MPDGERFTRRNLPHWYKPGFAHFVTYRLAKAIPVAKLREWRDRRDSLLHRGLPADESQTAFRERLHKQFFAAYDNDLDTRCTRNWLTDDRVAAMVRENLYHQHGRKYQLLAWCVMPNHVHVVLQPLERTGSEVNRVDDAGPEVSGRLAACHYESSSAGGETVDRLGPLSTIMHSLKSYTANRANEILRRTGAFWQPESYDHWIRDLDELERVVQYVNQNPVVAGLCDSPLNWRYSSAHDRFVRDGSESGLVGWLRDDWRG